MGKQSAVWYQCIPAGINWHPTSAKAHSVSPPKCRKVKAKNWSKPNAD